MNDMNHTHETNRKGIASSVLSRIEAEGVTPTPHSVFVIKEGAVWSVGALAALIGSLGVASIIFTAQNSEWEYYEATHDTLLTFAIEMAPYAWLLALMVFTIVAYEAVRHTKRGYRYPVPMLTLAVAGISVMGGVLISGMGGGSVTDQLATYLPPYRSLEEQKLRVWDKPERGLIAGIVTEVSETGESFTLRSPSNALHTVYMDVLDPAMRNEVSVGSFMRVMAPLMERPQFAGGDAFAEGMGVSMALMQDIEGSADADASMMMTTDMSKSMDMEAADSATDMALESTATEKAPEATMMMKAAPPPAPAQKTRGAGVPPPALLREACAILPVQRDVRGDERDERREAVKECLRELKEAREHRNDEDD